MQMAAMNMQMVARSWFMYELTGSAVMLGVVGLGSALPMLTVSLFGGVLADRIRKRGILIVGQFTSALVALGIAVSITLGAISWIHLFVAAFLQGLVMALMMPARQAIIYEVGGRKNTHERHCTQCRRHEFHTSHGTRVCRVFYCPVEHRGCLLYYGRPVFNRFRVCDPTAETGMARLRKTEPARTQRRASLHPAQYKRPGHSFPHANSHHSFHALSFSASDFRKRYFCGGCVDLRQTHVGGL